MELAFHLKARLENTGQPVPLALTPTFYVEATGYSYGTLRNSVYVAEKYEDLSLRNDNCPFSFHEIAAPAR